MAERKRLSNSGEYFEDDVTKTFSSGCAVLDCVLGGGWALNRVINIVGDKSTGKTLLAIEAAANFAKELEGSEIVYNETEHAFDESYARAVGFPVESVNFIDTCVTVEDLFGSLEGFLKDRDGSEQHALYIVDSLDALTSKEEQDTDVEKGTYQLRRAKLMSRLFRQYTGELSRKNVTLMIVSQERDNIGVTFGKKSTRSGGRALDFFSSQVMWLAKIQMEYTTRRKVKRPTGVKIKAKAEKNKVGPPFRECTFPIVFNYGIDDLRAGIAFLKETDRFDLLKTDLAGTPDAYLKAIQKVENKRFRKERKRVDKAVRRAWEELEEHFMPERSKY